MYSHTPWVLSAAYILGCQYGDPSRKMGSISVFFFCLFFFFISVPVEVLPVTPLLSGVLVHRVFCAYFVTCRFEGGWGNAYSIFLWCTQKNI